MTPCQPKTFLRPEVSFGLPLDQHTQPPPEATDGGFVCIASPCVECTGSRRNSASESQRGLSVAGFGKRTRRTPSLDNPLDTHGRMRPIDRELSPLCSHSVGAGPPTFGFLALLCAGCTRLLPGLSLARCAYGSSPQGRRAKLRLERQRVPSAQRTRRAEHSTLDGLGARRVAAKGSSRGVPSEVFPPLPFDGSLYLLVNPLEDPVPRPGLGQHTHLTPYARTQTPWSSFEASASRPERRRVILEYVPCCVPGSNFSVCAAFERPARLGRDPRTSPQRKKMQKEKDWVSMAQVHALSALLRIGFLSPPRASS